jgi:protein-disulfide isomerase
MLEKRTAALFLTAAAVAAVFIGRPSGGPLTDGTPSYRVTGPAGAPVTIVAFSDFQCPNCAMAEPVLKELLARHPGKIRFYFRHYPLRMHVWSRPAARAAEAAGLQGRFWEYHDLLFTRQKDWAVPDRDPAGLFLSYARELGLDADRFESDLSDDRWNALLSADGEAARSQGVDATPSFFINGERRVGASQLQADGERLVQLGGG